ncbi:MAG: hypothetical protein JWO71_1584 [Candidatus Acidoferrum typicum]|nr:hypothetical protein [Candidatus Acidoferrum typicum]
MPPDNRERSFENALAGHLRASAAKGVPHTECSDAETLAAYHEGSLGSEQIVSLKSHIADCERCQQILATLSATNEIPTPAGNLTLQPAAAPKSRVHVLPPRKTALWQWVGPAGALAAALLVWVAVHENNSLIIPAKAPSSNPSQYAEQAETVKPPPPASRTVSPSGASTSSNEVSSDSQQALRAAPPSPPQSRIAGLAREGVQTLSKQKDLSSAAKKSAAPADLDEFADSSPNRDNSLDRKELSAPNLEARKEIVITGADKTEMKQKIANGRRDAPSPKSPQAAPERNASSSPMLSAPAPSSAQTQVSTESAAVSGGITQQQETGGMSRFKQSEVRLTNSIAQVTISAPGGQVSWRVGQAGVIEFSPDAGKSWILQPSGAISDLLSGSAPSDKVCWIVGRGGTLLRTTDGGAHWQKMHAPSQEDLQYVLAVDARQATVSLASGKYQTTDGGITWKKLPPE